MSSQRRRRMLPTLAWIAMIGSACGDGSTAPSLEEPAEVEAIEGSELSRITLSERAIERLGIATVPVAAVGVDGTGLLVIPYSAVLYDADGTTWAYATSEDNVFVRSEIVVDRITGDLAYLAEGPPVGTEIVTTGAAELYGTETGVGGGH